MRLLGRTVRARLLIGAAAGVLACSAGLAHAQERAPITIAPQPLEAALYDFGGQTGLQVLFAPGLTTAKRTAGVSGETDVQLAMNRLLQGTGLSYRRDGDMFVIVKADADPQSAGAAGGGAEVEALIVTAQKREEDIQDVPIAISAFTQEALEQQKIEGGFDLLKAIPNVTFSKNNFTSYNFSIRGIGTKAVSATTDPAVAVSFNNMALLQNRLFEQEYFDIERVEVLRGPQGTLYGRNATAGVINVISAKPDMNDFDGWIKGEVGNYHSKRGSAMVNLPLIEDMLAVRFAGSFTDRQGYDFNTGTGHAVNGRDLWSARLTVGFNPSADIHADLIWERFEEDDDRSRTGKQLCHRDPGRSEIDGVTVGGGTFGGVSFRPAREALFSQGCLPGSLYDDAAFGTPNGLALPFVFGMLATGQDLFPINPSGQPRTLLRMADPYGEKMQSRDLRAIDSFRDPAYRAKADVVELNIDWNLSGSLTLSSQTVWNRDQTYSFQDFNRFNTEPIFADTSQFLPTFVGTNPFRNLAPGGIFCDPQLGCSDSLAGFDIAQAKGEQFSQEIRLQSDFDGPVNFSVGANYTRFKTLIDYYVFYNLITAYAMIPLFNDPQQAPGTVASIERCYVGVDFLGFGGVVNEPSGTPGTACPYIDPNPIESINGEGHNYFRSKNPFKLKSGAAFGELYWDVTPHLRVTAGLRYTDDRKTFIPVPSQVLLSEGVVGGGTVNRGYPEEPPIKQHWGEWTGRLGVDWKPDLAFTDQTMFYATLSRGYKAGGANPPSPGFGTKSFNQYSFELYGFPIPTDSVFNDPILSLTGVDYEPTFKPEFVNALEMGTKNTLMQGALTLNGSAFLYDYTDYQVSQIRNRTAVNENFDATVWGLELQSVFSPSRDFQLIANIGYLNTEIAEGETSIDIMDRTQGNPDLVVVKPWVQIPSNCVVPVWIAREWVESGNGFGAYQELCGGTAGLADLFLLPFVDEVTGAAYDPNYYDGVNHPLNINGGTGIKDDLGGNELPNAPHWTVNIGAQYGMDFLADWRVTLRGDAYWQSQSWHRVYNDNPYDKLHGWYNVNLSVWFEKPDQDLKIELYAKNLLDKTPITDAFLNSDDTALTTNVFVLDPRLIGLSIRKGF